MKEENVYYLILETFRKLDNKKLLISDAFNELRDAISDIEDATYNPVYAETVEQWIKRQEACVDG